MAKLKISNGEELAAVQAELALHKAEKEKLSAELLLARNEIAFQKEEKGKSGKHKLKKTRKCKRR